VRNADRLSGLGLIDTTADDLRHLSPAASNVVAFAEWPRKFASRIASSMFFDGA